MRTSDKMHDAKLARKLINAIASKLQKLPTGGVQIMEVCGTHTVSIFRSGLRTLLPEDMVLLSGPGCPVCVTPTGYLDHAIELSKRPDVVVATFGDMVKVPGSTSNLERERARGADIRVVYSVTDALKIATSIQPRNLVFLGVGFETTAPTIASALSEAKEQSIGNFFVLPGNKLIPPAMSALLDENVNIDAFLCPGHVSVITGAKAYQGLSEKYGKPCVVAGFEPLDVLQSILMILAQIGEGAGRAEIQYTRVVSWNGNETAQRLMERVFRPCDTTWRGLGNISLSGLRIREEFSGHDAAKRFEVDLPQPRTNPGCICGDVLRGVRTPLQCKLFAGACTPESPIGPCMVSSEGTCSAYFKYGRKT
jgi:hydrogenase expression/formation protein HypD